MTYTISTGWTVALLVAVVWELAWKGAGLWVAARRGQTNWFVGMLVVNSLGLLPIIYFLYYDLKPEKKYNHHGKTMTGSSPLR